MDNNTANDLILKIWAIDEKLTALRADLDVIETTLADQVSEG